MLKQFNNLKMIHKLLIAPVIVIVFLLIFSLFSWRGINAQRGYFRDYRMSAEALNDLANVHTGLYRLLMQAGTNYDSTKFETLVNEEIEQVNRIAEALQRDVSAGGKGNEEKKLYSAAIEHIQKYTTQVQKLRDILSTGLNVPPIVMTASDASYQDVEKDLKTIFDLEDRQSTSAQRSTLIVFLVVLTIAIALSLLASMIAAKIITKPLADITEKVDLIADGDLRVTVHAESSDEIGTLSGDVNKILVSIQHMIRDISGKTVQILNDATALTIHGKKVAQKVVSDLDRTTSAAAATEEMSATTTEISNNVGMMAKKTEQAKNVTSQGKDIVKQTIASITEVNQYLDMAAGKVKIMAEFSRKIDDILGTINRIADQTNLLALNAAIEAARAGEQGRGFAVVADEVRKLAQATASATSEINNILSSIRTGTDDATKMMGLAVEKAKVTESLAGRMDDSFETIYQSFENVSTMVNQIVSATEEQSTTSEDISHNLSGITKDAQESTHTVKEMIESFNKFGVGAKEFLKLLNNYTDPVLRVRILKADYILWIHRVMDLFDSKETLYLPDEFNPEKSRMGRWLYGEGRDLFGSLNSFSQLSSPHKLLHESGRQVYEALKKDDKEAVDCHFTKILQLNADILTIIDRLESEYSQANSVIPERVQVASKYSRDYESQKQAVKDQKPISVG